MSGHRITDDERARLHDALDLAIGLKNALTDASGERRRFGTKELLNIAVGQIASRLTGDVLAEWFAAEFRAGSTDTPIRFGEPLDPEKALSATDFDFCKLDVRREETGVQQGLRRASAFMMQELRPLFPPGVSEQISSAIVAEYRGDAGWIRSPKGDAGQRSTAFSRDVFRGALVQEVAYWRGRSASSIQAAFYDVMARVGIADMSWKTFEPVWGHFQKHAPESIEIAQSTGRAEMEGMRLNEQQREFLRDRRSWTPEALRDNFDRLKPKPKTKPRRKSKK